MTFNPTLDRANKPLLRALAANWWLILLRGIAGVIFGLLAFMWPGITALSLTFLWGGYALIDGVASLWAAITGGGAGSRGWLLLVGLLGIAAGIFAFVWPVGTAGVLLLFIAAWAIATGILQIWGAIRLRKEIEGEWLLIVSGVISILFGLVLVMQPLAGALAVVWMIAIFAIIFGIDHILLAFKLRSYKA
ncbi:MAG: HdeD family acid-resistance protein [Amaricoccus sp.]|uniref:HdeD family acid-resistance protein n=1 Tax=Amaricoccus sp. TaxID=1872485 RepID=UPI0039E56BE6